MIWLWPYTVPQLHYIRHEPSQGLDPVERTPPQSADNALRARGLPVLGLLLAPKKEGAATVPLHGRRCFIVNVVGTTLAVRILPSRLLMRSHFS